MPKLTPKPYPDWNSVQQFVNFKGSNSLKDEVCKLFEVEKLPLFEIGKFELKKEFAIIVE